MEGIQGEQLTASQREAVFHVEGPLLVLAGPGSGKTRVITHRIAALIDSGVRPYNICAITFTNKAAQEMRQRAIALGAPGGAHVSTFHSLCVRILRQYAGSAADSVGWTNRLRLGRVGQNFSIYDESDQKRCIRQAAKDRELDAKSFPPAKLLEAISTLKNNLTDVDSFVSGADDFFSRILAKVYARYQDILTENKAFDFDDLLMQTAFLLEDCPDIHRELGARFRFLLIDEYQDTNHAQYRIAKALASAHDNICATGDPDQSIYRWRGADIGNILAFEKDWPNAKVVRLEENFRSTPNILQAADNLIAFNMKRKQKKLLATRPPGHNVEITVLEDEEEEAEYVARQIKELTGQGSFSGQTAVFYRVNSMSRALEEALIRNKVAYRIVRGVEFYNRKEIRDVLAYLKVLVNPSDEVALLRIINTPARGIGKTTINRLRTYANSKRIGLYDALRRVKQIDSLSNATKAKVAVFASLIEQLSKNTDGPVASVLERVFAESGLENLLKGGDVQDQNAAENIQELINGAALYDQQAEEASPADYLQQIALFSDADSYDSRDRSVALMTLHTAKGLEFENVFIVGLEEGLLPHERSSNNEDELEEERRLFFVGLTRAKSRLCLSCAKYRTFRGQMLRTIPSKFLYELGLNFAKESEENQDEYDESAYSAVGSPFRRGQLVRHKSFGLGTVKDFVDMGENSVVVVRFTTGQTANLSRL